MKSWKTTLAGLITGIPVVIDALVTAYNAGAFTGKSGIQLVAGIGVVLFGICAKDKNEPGSLVRR